MVHGICGMNNLNHDLDGSYTESGSAETRTFHYLGHSLYTEEAKLKKMNEWSTSVISSSVY